MANTLIPLKDFLEERKLTQKKNSLPLAETRERFEESAFLETLRELCAAINAQAGKLIVEEHRFLWPEPVVSSFTFVKGQTEYVMRVECSYLPSFPSQQTVRDP